MKHTFPLLASLVFSSMAAPLAWAQEAAAPKADAKPAAAAAPADDQEKLSEKEERKFSELAASYCKAVFPVKDDYLLLPNYSATYPSSRGLSRVTMFNQLTDVRVLRSTHFNNGLQIQEKREKKVPPVRGDVEAACALRNLNQGEYGELESVHIVKILGKDEMLVDDARLFDPKANSNLIYSSYRNGDPNQRVQKLWQEVRESQEKVSRDANGASRLFRLVGHSTLGLREGDRWSGPGGKRFKVAVGRVERAAVEQKNRFRGFQVPEAVRDEELILLANPDKLGKSIEKKEFEAFLAKWKITKAEFLEICQLAAENNKGADKIKAAALAQLGVMGERAAAASEAKEAAKAAEVAVQAQAQARAEQTARFTAEMERQAALARERNNWRNRQPVPEPAQAPRFQAPPQVAVAPGTPIFKSGEENLQPVAAPQAPTQVPAQTPAQVKPEAKKYLLVPANAQVDALVDLKNRDILGKLIIGRWQAQAADAKLFWLVCAVDGTYQAFDANDARIGNGEYRITGKGQVVFIGQTKEDLVWMDFTSPNTMDDGTGAGYQRVVPNQ